MMYISPFLYAMLNSMQREELLKASAKHDLYKLKQEAKEKAKAELETLQKLYNSAVKAKDWELKDRLLKHINKQLDIIEIK